MASREFKPMDELMSPLLVRLARQGGAVALGPLWAQVAGAQIARQVRVVALEQRVLVLEAVTARWKVEMVAHEAALVKKLNDALGPGTVVSLQVRVAG